MDYNGNISYKLCLHWPELSYGAQTFKVNYPACSVGSDFAVFRHGCQSEYFFSLNKRKNIDLGFEDVFRKVKVISG